jgi:hypothetical protein
MEIMAYMGGVLGLIAFIRVEHLIRTLRKAGTLSPDFDEE